MPGKLAGTPRGLGLSDVLSKAEIESLIGSLTSEPESEPVRRAAAGANRQRQRGIVAYEVYDFRRPDKFSKEQLRTLQMLNESFGRLAGSSLSAYLRLPVAIELVALEQVPFEEYLRGINQSAFVLLSLPPLPGQAVLEVEFPVAFTMIDRLLGGPGRPFDRTVFSDIEAPLVRDIVARLCQCLQSSWEGLAPIEPSVESVEVSSQFVQIAPPTDIVISMLYEVRLGETRGALSLCVPYLMLKPVTGRLSGHKWFVQTGRRAAPTDRGEMSKLVKDVTVDCAVRLDPTPIRLEEYRRIRVGDVIQLNHKVEDRLTLFIHDVPTHTGRIALDGPKIVFTVSDEESEETLPRTP